jgi:hypothetical protein
LKVVEVAPGGPADQAGIVPGDILKSIDSRTLKEPADLAAAERAMEPGRAVQVVLDRGGRSIMTFSMRPGQVPGQSAPTGNADASAPAGAGAAPVIGAAGVAGAAAGVSAQAGASAAEGASAPAATSAPAGTDAPAGTSAAEGASAAAPISDAVGANAPASTSAPVGAGVAAGSSAPAVAGATTVILAGPTGPSEAAEPVPVPSLAPTDTTSPQSANAATPAGTDIRANGAAGLGVRCENLSLDLAMALGAKAGQGVLVLGVTPGSPAALAGIRPGDVISHAAAQPVVDVGGLDKIIATATSPLSIVTLRGGTTRVVAAEFPVPPAPEVKASDAQSTDQLLASLRDEVRSLREELRKLREELANPAKGSNVPHP